MVYGLVLTSYIVNVHRPSTAAVVRAVERHDNLGVARSPCPALPQYQATGNYKPHDTPR